MESVSKSSCDHANSSVNGQIVVGETGEFRAVSGVGPRTCPTRPSSLGSWLPWLDSRWKQGVRNALAFWREMRAEGFHGQSGVVSQWAQRRRFAEKANQSGLARTPSARVIVRLMTSQRDDLTKSEAILVAAIEGNVPELVVARATILGVQSMIRSKTAAKLDGWLHSAKESLVGSFASGVEKDIAAVRNAICCKHDGAAQHRRVPPAEMRQSRFSAEIPGPLLYEIAQANTMREN
jgi:hypothetical protein